MSSVMNSYFFFFFSSRRRHTRCSRDWSSDVCSSDLGNNGRFAEGGNAVCQRRMGAKKRSERAAPKKGLYDAQGRTRRRYSRRRNAIVDRKSTRLNSSHGYISYAVFCLKKKKSRYDVLDIIRAARASRLKTPAGLVMRLLQSNDPRSCGPYLTTISLKSNHTEIMYHDV